MPAVIGNFIVRSVETLFRNRRTSLSVPERVSVSLYFRLQGSERTHQSSESKKSLQSARSISLTPGSRTMELMGRFGRAPVHVQHPQVLDLELSDPTRKDADQMLTCRPCRCELYARRPFHTRVLLRERAVSRCCYYVRRRCGHHIVSVCGAVEIRGRGENPPDLQLRRVAVVLIAFCPGDLLELSTN
jgi:hypothetical protein